MGNIISFLNNKGGIGKTASTVTVAHMAASVFHKRVLLIDMDPQANTSSRFSQVDYVKILKDILNGRVSTDNTIEQLLLDETLDPHDFIVSTGYANLDLIPSSQTLAEAEERLKANVRTPQQFKLKMQLEKVRNEYDLIVIDCSPSINLLNINALVASDEVYIPAKCDGDSLIGVAISINLISTVQTYNPALKVEGVFFTQYNGKKNVSKAAYGLLDRILCSIGTQILPVAISVSTLLERSSLTQEPLLEIDNKRNPSKVTKEYMVLTEYILNPNKNMALAQLMGTENEGICLGAKFSTLEKRGKYEQI